MCLRCHYVELQWYEILPRHPEDMDGGVHEECSSFQGSLLWIEDKDRGRKFMLNDGDVKKSAYSLLKTWGEEDVSVADDEDEDDNEDHKEFEYDSDPEENTIILCKWDRMRGGRRVRNSFDDSDKDEIGSNGDAGGGDDEEGHVPNGDEERSIDNDGMNSNGEDDVEDSSDDEEETAVAAVTGGTNNNKRKRSGQQSQPTDDDRRTLLRCNRGTWR